MVDIAQVMSLAGSLKTAGEIVQAMMGLRDGAMVQDKAIELNGIILSAQSSALAANAAQLSLLARINRRLCSTKTGSVRSSGVLKAIDLGAFAYMPKPGMENGEPPHWLCPNCFNRKQKAFLQFKGQDIQPSGNRGEYSTYACDGCKASVKVAYVQSPLTPWNPSR